MPANSKRHSDRDGFHDGDLDLTAFALDQLDEAERAEIARRIAEASGDAPQLIEQTKRLAEKAREALAEANPPAGASLRETLVHRLGNQDESSDGQRTGESGKSQPAAKAHSFWRRYVTELAAAGVLVVLLAALFIPAGLSWRQSARRTVAQMRQSSQDVPGESLRYQRALAKDGSSADEELVHSKKATKQSLESFGEGYERPITYPSADGWREIQARRSRYDRLSGAPRSTTEARASGGPGLPVTSLQEGKPATSGSGPSDQYYFQGNGPVPGGGVPTGDKPGGGQPAAGFALATNNQQGQGPSGGANGVSHRGATISAPNYAGSQKPGVRSDGQPTATDFTEGKAAGQPGAGFGGGGGLSGGGFGGTGFGLGSEVKGTEQYAPIVENAFIPVQGIDALSTFSIDVDTASYANVRRFLTQGQLPPPDAVRIEELVNYFSYDYPQPKAGEPFSVNMEVAECPWQQQHLLLRVGLKGREIHQKERPVSNLVFLLDVSGSMADANKLPLLKQVLSMMVRELREDDRVSIVTYAGEAGLRLPPTTGDQQVKILQAIDSLQSGGSTNGSAGIELAYDQAQAYFRKEGTNRVILATDGDLNVGITDDESLVKLIKEKAVGGTFLTVLGFGEGNLKDAKMEQLADNGNGLYAYIDSIREGRKVLIEQMSGSLVTIAKDVKIQIEFNPANIQSYRLLGYENRILTAPEFNDNKRDAGEIGAGHAVTALYELVPTGLPQSPGTPPGATDPLKYQSNRLSGIAGEIPKAGSLDLSEAARSGELLTLKLRYKEPDGQVSKLSEYPLKDRGGKFNAAAKDFQFAAAVASFGLNLRNSQHRGDGNLAATAEIATGAVGEDRGGYRAEFVYLVRKAQSLGIK